MLYYEISDHRINDEENTTETTERLFRVDFVMYFLGENRYLIRKPVLENLCI